MHIFAIAQGHSSELEWPQPHCPYCGHLVIKTKSQFIPHSPLYSPVSNFQLIFIPLLCVLFFLVISRTIWLDFFGSLSCVFVLLGFFANKCSLVDLFLPNFFRNILFGVVKGAAQANEPEETGEKEVALKHQCCGTPAHELDQIPPCAQLMNLFQIE